MAEIADLVELNIQFEKESPQDALRWAAQTYGESLAVVTSFQPTGIVTLHMLSEMGFRPRVLTLDTGLLFPETYNLMDELETKLNLNLERIRPALTVTEQAQQYGEALWNRNPDQCCEIRKVVPLGKVLEPYKAWITGLRRDQSSGRSNIPILEHEQRYNRLKISPLATWTEDMVWTYIHAHELPYNALHDQNYFSIGCQPCTRPVAAGEDRRSGRWSGSLKTECGIHTTHTTKGNN